MGNKTSSSRCAPLNKSQIESLPLSDLKNASTIVAKSLWEKDDSIVILYLIRRPGCQLCREQAELLSDMIEFNMHGVKLVGIVHENSYLG